MRKALSGDLKHRNCISEILQATYCILIKITCFLNQKASTSVCYTINTNTFLLTSGDACRRKLILFSVKLQIFRLKIKELCNCILYPLRDQLLDWLLYYTGARCSVKTINTKSFRKRWTILAANAHFQWRIVQKEVKDPDSERKTRSTCKQLRHISMLWRVNLGHFLSFFFIHV